MTAALAPYWTHKERLLTKHDDACGICHRPIDLRLVRPNPGSFTIDHIHPRSKGGCDHVENLRPAHLGCNSRRGDRVTHWPTCRACTPPMRHVRKPVDDTPPMVREATPRTYRQIPQDHPKVAPPPVPPPEAAPLKRRPYAGPYADAERMRAERLAKQRGVWP